MIREQLVGDGAGISEDRRIVVTDPYPGGGFPDQTESGPGPTRPLLTSTLGSHIPSLFSVFPGDGNIPLTHLVLEPEQRPPPEVRDISVQLVIGQRGWRGTGSTTLDESLGAWVQGWNEKS